MSFSGGIIVDKSNRPVISTPINGLDIALEAIAAIGIVLNVAVAFVYVKMPGSNQVFSGNSALTLLLLVVAAPAALYLLLTIISRYPRRFNYLTPITEKNAAIEYGLAVRMLRWMKAVFVWMFWGLQTIFFWSAPGTIVPASLALTFTSEFITVGILFYYIARMSRYANNPNTYE